MDKSPQTTDFKQGINQIFPDESICSNKVQALTNFLVPKIMYIPFNQIEQIKEKLTCLETTIEQNGDYLPLLNMVHAFLIYRQGQYEQALVRIKDYECKKESLKDDFTQACYATIEGACYRSLGQKEMH